MFQRTHATKSAHSSCMLHRPNNLNSGFMWFSLNSADIGGCSLRSSLWGRFGSRLGHDTRTEIANLFEEILPALSLWRRRTETIFDLSQQVIHGLAPLGSKLLPEPKNPSQNITKHRHVKFKDTETIRKYQKQMSLLQNRNCMKLHGSQ